MEVNSAVKNYVFDYLQREYTIKSNDIMSLDFISEGYINSMGMLSFIANLEERFNIEFSVDELLDPKFHVVGELINLISEKIK